MIKVIIILFVFIFNSFSFSLVLVSKEEQERENASVLFDQNTLTIPSKINKDFSSQQNFTFLLEMKQVLSSGKWSGSIPQTRHFIFRNSQEGWSAQAQSPGLEGFYWTKMELENKYGADKFIHHLNDYFSYLNDVLSPISWTKELRDALNDLKNKPIDNNEKNKILNAMLENYIMGLRKNMDNYDKASWIKKARIYELFPRAYNLEGRRENPGYRYFKSKKFFQDFTESDFDIIKKMGFDTIWPMGILPIGKRGQTGTGGGSPYSISDHSTINPDLGTEEDFRNFVKKAHNKGLKVIVDFVVNHTSLDSKLLFEDPKYFISYESVNGSCPKNDWFSQKHSDGKIYCVHNGGFEYNGGVSSWIDTAQINYSNTKLRERMIEILKGWINKFDIDGFRVDMAYLAVNQVFSRTWNVSMPYEEFYRLAIKELKMLKPSIAFLAEAYAFQEDLSAFGFDSIYSKYEESRIEGQTGWYNSTESQNPNQIASSINRNAFLAWQKGGAGSVVFIGNHDEPAPENIYGNRLPSALILTMLYPGGVMMYSGAEIGYDAHIPNGEPKPLPFSIPCQIEWDKPNLSVKNTYQKVLSEVEKIRKEMGDYVIEPLWFGGNISGYIMKSTTNPNLKKAVIANLTLSAGNYSLNGQSGYLPSGEYKIIDIK